jgi:DNA processing protein
MVLYYFLLDKQLKNRRIISIGTRQITSYGTEFLEIDRDLAPWIPISVLLYGVDIVAHQMAMDHIKRWGVTMKAWQTKFIPKRMKKYVASGRKRWFYDRVLEHSESG